MEITIPVTLSSHSSQCGRCINVTFLKSDKKFDSPCSDLMLVHVISTDIPCDVLEPGDPVVIKQTTERSFDKELRSLNKLRNDLIIKLLGTYSGCKVLDFEWESFYSQTQKLLLIPYIEGESLYQLILTQKINNCDTLKILIQVASAIQACHLSGITHRDIKCENIMVSPEGKVTLIDFGWASSKGIMYGKAGTPFSLSYEMARKVKYTSLTDVWSFGVLIYELITTELPFGDDRRNVNKILMIQYDKSKLPKEYLELASKHMFVEEKNRSTIHEILDILIEMDGK